MVMYSPTIASPQNASRGGLSLLQSVLHLLTDTELHAVQAHITLELRLRATGGSHPMCGAQRGEMPCTVE